MKRLSILTIVFSIIFQTVAFARSSSFTDVSGNEYYAEAAQELWENGIISGYEDGSLRADQSVSRAEMATFICRLLGEEEIAEGYKGFTSTMTTDVPSSHWASGYITYAVIGGIVNGDGNGKFRPDDKVRYAEAIKMIVCAIGLEDKVISYPDDWSRGYIEVASDKGLLDDVTYKGGEYSTRGDVAVMLYNALSYMTPKSETNWELDWQIPTNPTQNPISSTANFEEEVIKLVNEERSKEGLNPLSYDAKLSAVAYAHSCDMRDRNFFDHENPDGESPFDRMRRNGITYRAAAENIAKGQTSPKAVMDAWMNSPGHRANILNPALKYIGVGICEASYGYYWTQCFTG